MTESSPVDLEETGPLYLVAGERVLAEPTAVRLGEALAARVGCEMEVHRRPAELGRLLADLRTYSLFSPAKVVIAVETAVLADRGAASRLIDEALEVCPVGLPEEVVLTDRVRRSGSCLLQTLHLFELDAESGDSSTVIGRLPDWALEGRKVAGRRRRSRQVEGAREHLAGLLDVARAEGLRGWAETDVGELAEIARSGLPEGHVLVLAESAIAEDHPLVKTLSADGRYLSVGRVEAARRGGWKGLDLLAEELRRETGVGIAPSALEELARRTIQRREGRPGSRSAVDADTTARLAAEYRKLANLVSGGEIRIELVENVVEDRGEEDAWKTLDAIGAGRPEEALHRIRRLLAAAEDPIAARLSFFALLAGFARQLSALSHLIEVTGVPRRAVGYSSFKSRIAPRLQGELTGGRKNPLAGLHPYRLYRVFKVACRLPATRVSRLPAAILETELRLKGESRQPEAALTALVCELSTAIRDQD